MDANENCEVSHICFLPDEVISSILLYNDLRDVVSFSSTSKRFNELLGNNNFLWKQKYEQALSLEFQNLVTQNKDNIDWLYELKQFYLLKKTLISELIHMSPQFYWRSSEVSLEDLKPFFKVATKTYIHFYYTVYILQEIISETKKVIENGSFIKPVNTLTNVYYAKKVLRHLMQTYLCIKWARHVTHQELTPEVVVNFFVQWIDPDTIHTDEDVEDKIQCLVSEVRDILKASNKSSLGKPHTGREILLTVSEVIYKRRQITASSLDTNAKTLDIVKVIDQKHGSVITLGTIYQAVARRLGVHCELNAFSNHFFLEWQCNEGGSSRIYTIDLTSGELRPKRQCPFSHRPNVSSLRYHPDSLIQFIFSAYMQSKGSVQDWEYQNASHLFDFLASHEAESVHNPYKDFFLFLGRYAASPALGIKINMKSMDQEHRKLMLMLSELNEPQVSNNKKIVKIRKSDLKYAVGMVCYHVQYYYMCVIRNWEVDDARKPRVNEPHVGKQPIYTVITEDQCVRYVPQEKICQLSQPQRLKSIEDILGRDFTHFDGFSYVGNAEKMEEYPDDRSVIEKYINDCFTKKAGIQKSSFYE